jgi:GWxTD domain-containing protein
MTEYTEVSQGSLRFYLQRILLVDSLGKTNIEYSYSLPMDQLQFITEGTSYTAGYTMSIIVFDPIGQQVAGDTWERNIKIDDYNRLQRGDSILADTMIHPLPQGEYRARISCHDKNSDKVGVFDMALVVPKITHGGYFGGLRFERDYNGTIIPWPSRIYGDGIGPIMFHMSMYYDRTDSLKLNTVLFNSRTQIIAWQRSKPVSVRSGQLPCEVIPTDSLADGNYEIRLELSDPERGLLWRREFMVIVQNPGMISKSDFDERIAQVEYIARKGEFDTLSRAEPEQRDSLWKQFWKSRDPTPDTEKNEYRDSYYEKINYANRNFGTSIRPGWKTDMGRVYIKYGSPDEIERHPFEIDSQPYEIWYYYQAGLKIIFLDRHGFGDYRIVYTNKEI